MKIKIFLFFIVLFLFQRSNCFSQNNKNDSLLGLLTISKSDTTTLNVLNELSWQYINTGNYEQAMGYANQAIDLSRELMHSSALSKQSNLAIKKNLGKSYNYLGIIYKYKGDFDKALEFYFKALKIKEETADKNGVASAYNNIGTIYTSKDYFDKALEFYFKSLKIFEEIGDKNGIAASYNNIGNNHYLRMDYDKALEFYSRSLKIREETGDQKGMAKSYNNFGLIHSVRKEYDKSLEYYFKALAIRTTIDDKNGMASSHRNIGDVYLMQKKLTEAKKHLLEALNIATEINAKPIMIETYQSLSRCDSTQGDFKGAYYYYQLYTVTKDEVFDAESDKSLNEMQTKYESQKKEKEIALLNKENEKQASLAAAESKRQKQILFSVSGFLVLVITFSFFMYRGYRQKQRTNEIISEQKIEVEKQRDLIEIKNKEVTDRIHYAKRIQGALLASDNFLKKHLPEYFIFYKPKDIVSGDFYWASEMSGKFYISVADCTGHGVPGAFMSLLNISFLNEAIIEKKIESPDKILEHIRSRIVTSLNPEGTETESKDGMDAILCMFDFKGMWLRFACANNPLWLIRNDELKEFAADKMPVGAHYGEEKSFSLQTLGLRKGDIVYLFTDGYADQFGMPAEAWAKSGGTTLADGKAEGKKFKYKQLQQILLDNNKKTLAEQKQILNDTMESWRGELEQVDDILIIGIRV